MSHNAHDESSVLKLAKLRPGQSIASSIKNVGISAKWNGLPDHAAQVRISIQIQAEPSTAHALIDLASQEVDNVSTYRLPKDSLPLCDPGLLPGWQHSPQSDQDALKSLEEKVVVKGSDEKVSPRTLSPTRSNLSEAVGSANRASITNVSKAKETQPQSDDSNCDSVHYNTPAIRATKNQFGTDIGQMPLLSLALFEDDAPGSDGRAEFPLGSSPCSIFTKDVSGGPLVQEVGENEPATRRVIAAHTWGANSRKPSFMAPLRAVSGNCLGTSNTGKLSSFEKNTSMVRRTGGRKFHAMGIDTTQFFHSSPHLVWSSVDSSSIPSHDGNQILRTRSFNSKNLNNFGNFRDKGHSDVVSPDISSSLASRKGSIRYHKPTHYSPNVSPRMWLRRSGPSDKYFVDDPVSSSRETSNPRLVKESGKLYICFDEYIATGIYQVEIDTSCLLESEAHSWQRFTVPTLQNTKEANITTRFSFELVSASAQSKVPELQFSTEFLLEAEVFNARKLMGRIPPMEGFSLLLRLKETIHHLTDHETSVTLCCVPTWSESKGIRFEYHVSLMLELQNQDFFSERISFPIVIRHGHQLERTYNLGTGECTVYLEESDGHKLNSAKSETETGVEVTLVRDTQDCDKPLNVHFKVTYGNQDRMLVPLPTFRPRLGKVRSESVLLVTLSPPLDIEHLPRCPVSSWKKGKHHYRQYGMIRFDRTEIPLSFPRDLEDDIVVKVILPIPVHFQALESLTDPMVFEKLINIIPKVDIRVEEVMGGLLACQARIKVQVGSHSRLLILNYDDWSPSFSTIDGRLATEKTGEWRETNDGYSTLFKTAWMVPGQITMVQMHWTERVILDEFKPEDDDKTRIEYKLPRIVGKTILESSLTCKMERSSSITLEQGMVKLAHEFPTGFRGKQLKLPTLYDGYDMRLSLHRAPIQAIVRPGQTSGNILPSDEEPLLLRTIGCESEQLDIPSNCGLRFECSSGDTTLDSTSTIPSACVKKPSVVHDSRRLHKTTYYLLQPLGCIVLLFKYVWKVPWMIGDLRMTDIGILCLLVQVGYLGGVSESISTAIIDFKEIAYPQLNAAVDGWIRPTVASNNLTEVVNEVPGSSSQDVPAAWKEKSVSLLEKENGEAATLSAAMDFRNWIDHALGWREWRGFDY